MKKIYALLFALMITGLGFGQVFITELADPNDNANARYIELYNAGGSTVDLSGWTIDKYTNASATVSQSITLTGSITSGGFYIIATGPSDTVVFNTWGVTPDQWDPSANHVAGSNGDDNLELYDNSSILIDQFGVPGQDGTGTCHEFEDGRAERIATVTSGNTIWDESEWNIWADSTVSGCTNHVNGAQNTTDSFDPGAWIGAVAGCTAPSTQASAYNTTALGTTSATLNWTSGDGDEVLVLIKEGSVVDADPTNGTTYTANTAFGSGDQIGTGNFAVQSGSSATSVSVTGLTPGNTYYAAIYEYNTTDTCYELTELIGSFTTDCSTPIDVSTFTASPGNTTIDLSWTNGSCFDEILVVAKATSAVTAAPSGDGTAYTADATFGSGTDLGGSEFAVFKGTGTSVTVTGLTNGTTYHFTAFARKTTSWSTGISDSDTPADVPVAGDIVISEIMYNSSGTDDEWIEIYNASGADITLNSDWRLVYDGSTYDFSGTLITSGSYITIAVGSNGDGTFNNDNPFTPDISTIASPLATASTNNTNNIVNGTATIAIIFDAASSNVTIDTVTFDDGSPWPTTPDGNGPSLELIDVLSDNSLAASWAASDNDGGTPGSAYPKTFTFTGTWSPSDPDGVATASDVLIIASGNATITTSTTCDTATVNPGASLTVNTGVTLTATNGLTLESVSNSYSSLILNGSITGIVNYERHVNGNSGLGDTNANGNNDLISPPLSGQTFGAFASANSNLLANPGDANEKAFAPFDKTTGDYENYLITTNSATTLVAGVGYRAATDNTASLTFTGTVNTGNVTNNIIISGPAHEEWNVIGNPYPSYLNVQAFLNYEVSIGITNLDLFDTATAAIYGYDGNAGTGNVNNYTIYNLATTSPTTVIAPGQGFLVSTNPLFETAFDVTFTPGMQSSGTTDDFIAGRSSDVIQNLELQISTMSKNFVTDLYFNNNASLGLDPGYDAAIFDSAPAFSIYSHLVEENTGTSFAVQALDVTDLMNTTIPLGVNANSGEQLVFSISESTLSSTVNVYLDDALNNTSTLLNSSDYTITPNTNLNGTGRFYLRVSNSTLSTPQNSLDNLSIYSNINDRTVVITGQILKDTKAIIYDIQGRVVSTSILQSTNRQQTIDVSNLNAGIYVVQIVNGTQNKTQKVILH